MQYLSRIQLNIKLQGSPIRFVTNPTPLSLNELMCNMNYKHPCTPTPLYEGLGRWLWFTKTPSHTLAFRPSSSKTTISPWLKLNIDDITPPKFARNLTSMLCECAKNSKNVMNNLEDSKHTTYGLNNIVDARGVHCNKHVRVYVSAQKGYWFEHCRIMYI
jgi:hypothetical protein